MSNFLILNFILPPLNLTNTTVSNSVIVNAETKVSLPAIVATWLLIPIMFLSTFLNVVVLLAFISDRKLWTPFNYYLCNLGLCDTIIGSIDTVFYFMYNRAGTWQSSRSACDLWLYLDWIVTIAVAYSLMFISLDRLWAITYPIGYRTYHSRRLSALTISVMWVAVNLIVLPGFLIERRSAKDDEFQQCYQDFATVKSWAVSAQFIGYYLPHFTVIVTNIIIGVKLRQSLSSLGGRGIMTGSTAAASVVPGGFKYACKACQPDTSASCTHMHLSALSAAHSPSRTLLHSAYYYPISHNLFPSTVMEEIEVNIGHNIRNLNSNLELIAPRDNDGRNLKKQSMVPNRSVLGHSPSRRYIRKKDRRAIRLLASLVICFTVCWTPSYTYFSMITFLPKYQNEAFFSFSYVLAFTNSVLNPLLYHIGSKEFRTAINKLLVKARAMTSWPKKFEQ